MRGSIQFGVAPGCSANEIEPALPEGVPAAGITPTEPGSRSPPGELEVGVALPLLLVLLQAARAVTPATARASPPMRLLPNLVIPLCLLALYAPLVRPGLSPAHACPMDESAGQLPV